MHKGKLTNINPPRITTEPLPGGEKYEYFNLKNEKASEMNEVIERIIHHVNTEWGIKVMLKDKTKMPEAKELWAGAYTEQWNLPLSKLNK